MVNIISSLRSIRFRLILVVILVVAALLFQTFFLVATQDLQTNFENKGDEYLETDTIILSQLNELSAITDKLEVEHVATLLGDLLFNEEVDISIGQDTFGEYLDLMSIIQSNLTTRQELGYFIDSESESTLLDPATIFQNPKLNQSIIDNTETGIASAFSDFKNSFVILREDIRFDFDGSVIHTGNFFAVDLILEAETELKEIRNQHNLNIENARGQFENTTGFVSIISARVDQSLNLLLNESDPSELNRKLHMLELFRQISEYVSFVSRFEKLNLAIASITQSAVEEEITEFRINIDARSNNITELASLIQSENALIQGVIQSSIGYVKSAFTNVHTQIGNALNFSSITLGRIIEDTRNLITEVTEDLLAEQFLFQTEFDSLLNKLDNDLRDQTQTISIIIILAIFLLVGSTAFILVRYFNRYERNYRLIGEGKLNIPARKHYADNEIGRVNHGFDNMIAELKGILSALQRSSERMAGIAEELAAGSEEASASVQEVSNTVREFSAGAAEQNLMLNRIDEKLSAHLKTIEDATSQINETSNFVLKVAKRTNILGLNASIEAAKAGKFGLGFNVVAEEVRNLSSDTKTSALEIADLIEVIETKIQTTIREIQQEVNITKDVAENTAAGSEEANAATSEQVVMLNEISQTSNELSLLANELQELLNRFDLS
ncbi:MAG: Methyl-accepting chemotaxis protein McpB [Candidatus Heimdallarchaeota archaeon LC_2]|nr:MAG: Methyl-accepting chemotaxis protein McpB [Candidatus Heimdallarchaeota archaeon LC_2]